MKRPVAPELSRAVVECTLSISVVCIDTLSSKEFNPGFKATMYCLGSCFSQFRHLQNWDQGGEDGGTALESFTGVSVEGIESDSYISSTDKAAKQLLVDNGGILITHCLGQNPLVPPRWYCLLFPLSPLCQVLQTQPV
jgi:hypothetical protein